MLLELDADSLVVAQASTRTKLESISGQLPLIETELASYDRAARAGSHLVASSDKMTTLRESVPSALARYMAEEQKNTVRLNESGLVSRLEMLKILADNEQKQVELQALKLGASRDSWAFKREEEQDRATVGRLRRELASLEGEKASLEDELSRLGMEVELRTIRAPIAGRIAKLNQLHKGSVVAQGFQIAVIAPSGPLRVVADFPSVSVGKIRPGQFAEVRLDGFPWTEFGTVRAHVERIGSEPGSEGVRVELALAPDQSHTIPMEHGLVGTVAIRVDEVTPWRLMLRNLGGTLHPRPGVEASRL